MNSYTDTNHVLTVFCVCAEESCRHWCSICDALQASAIKEFANPKLQDLTKLFKLSPDLLSV